MCDGNVLAPRLEYCFFPDAGDSPHILLDLSCGVLDLKSEEATLAAERAMEGFGPESRIQPELSSSSSGDSEHNSGSESNEDSSDNETLQHLPRKEGL